MDLPEDLLALLREPAICFVTTLMPDGSPQITETWVGTDGKHILINTVRGHHKLKNVERDPRVAVSVLDKADPTNYYSVAGTVVGIDTAGAREHIEALSLRYTGGPYQNYSGKEQVRVLLTIRVDRIVHAPWH